MNIYLKQDVIVDTRGFITHWANHDLVNESFPIYMVLFKDYSRIDPFCRPLDMSQPIKIIKLKQDQIDYTKNIEDYTFTCSIKIVNQGIDWRVYPDSSCVSHSFGLALPCNYKWCNFSQTLIKEDISNYAQFLHEAFYRDQQILNIPFVSVGNISVFGSLTNDYQFFRYKDNQQEWLRVISFTKLTDHTEICLRDSRDPQDSTAIYLEKFPESDKFVNKWKSKLEKMGNEYSVQILYQQSDNHLQRNFISRSTLSSKDLQNFYPILESEFQKYPSSIFKELGIRYIILVSDLYLKTSIFKKIDGSTLWYNENETDKGLMFDAKTGARLIHHEIFHAIEKSVDFNDVPGKINPISVSCEITGMSEYLAELFAILMINPGKAYKFSGSSEQIEYLREKITNFLIIPNPSTAYGDERTIYALEPDGIKEIKFRSVAKQALRYAYNYSDLDNKKCH